MKRIQKGFTLVELLIVIAVLGVLAATVLVAIDPVQQMARARDAGRKNSIGQIGTALVSFYTSRSATYPAADVNWLVGTAADPDGLVYAGELKSAPPLVAGGTVCRSGAAPAIDTQVNGYCYASAAGPPQEAVVWTTLEAKTEKAKCAAAAPVAVFYYSTVNGMSCLGCVALFSTALTPATTCNAVQ